MLLAIDTSTAQTGLALYDTDGLLAECNWHSGRQHTAQLLPQLARLLENLERTPDMLSAIAVATGPGSWSGLRVGMSTAKGLAMARALPIIGIGTLDVLAAQHWQPGLRVQALLELGRDRYASAIYADDMADAAEPQILTTAAALEPPPAPTVYCGDLGRLLDGLHAMPEGLARIPRPAARIRRAGVLAELGWLRLQHGDTDDLATLEPIYLGQAVRQQP